MSKFLFDSVRGLIFLLLLVLLSLPAFSKAPPGSLGNPATPIPKNAVVSCDLIYQGEDLAPPFIPEEKAYQAIAATDTAIRVNWAGEKGFVNEEVIPYLKNSKEFQDMLRLRRTALHIRAQLVEKKGEIDQATKEYLNLEINSPLILVGQSPFGLKAKSGPMLMPTGIEVFDPIGNKRISLNTSCITLTDLVNLSGVTEYSIKDSIDNDTLDFVVGHEMAHEIMCSMYGKSFNKIQRVTKGHGTYEITDYGVALIEGWAEAFEALYGINNPRLKKKNMEKYMISEFIFERQDPIRRDRAVYLFPVVNERKKQGLLKNGCQMMSCEGVVAGLFYDILTSRTIVAPFDKCVTTMATSNPLSFHEFVNDYLKLYPEDRNTIIRIILENTKYTTMSKDAGALYRKYYTTKLSYVKHPKEKEAFTQAQNAFNTFKDDLFQKALKGANIFANVGPEVWVTYRGFGVMNWNLNTICLPALISMGALGRDDSDSINIFGPIDSLERNFAAIGLLQDREKAGFLKGDAFEILCNLLKVDKFGLLEAYLVPYSPESKKAASPTVAYWSRGSQNKVFWPEDVLPKHAPAKKVFPLPK